MKNSDWIALVVGSAGGTAGVLAVCWAAAKSFIEKRIDQHYSKLEALFKEQLALNQKAAETIVQQELAIYPALSELIYKAKIGAQEAVEADTVFAIAGQNLVSACQELTTKLYVYRIYLPDNTWQAVHNYKHALQDLLVLGDIATRADRPDHGPDIPPQIRQKIKRTYKRIERLNSEITSQLREHVANLRGPL